MRMLARMQGICQSSQWKHNNGRETGKEILFCQIDALIWSDAGNCYKKFTNEKK